MVAFGNVYHTPIPKINNLMNPYQSQKVHAYMGSLYELIHIKENQESTKPSHKVKINKGTVKINKGYLPNFDEFDIRFKNSNGEHYKAMSFEDYYKIYKLKISNLRRNKSLYKLPYHSSYRISTNRPPKSLDYHSA